MKLPLLNIYVSTVDWKTLFEHERQTKHHMYKKMNDYLSDLSKYKTARDPKTGRFISESKIKQDAMTAQLKAENDARDAIDWDKVRKAGM